MEFVVVLYHLKKQHPPQKKTHEIHIFRYHIASCSERKVKKVLRCMRLNSWLHFLLLPSTRYSHAMRDAAALYEGAIIQCWTYGMQFHLNTTSKGEHLSGVERFMRGASGSVLCCVVRWRVWWWIPILFTSKRLVYTVGLWGWKLAMGKRVRINSFTVELSHGLTFLCCKMEKTMMRTPKYGK